MKGAATRDSIAEEIVHLAHQIVRGYTRGEVQDSEEYADVCLALWQARRVYDPEKGAYSTFAYTVGRRAMYKGWCRRSRPSLVAVNEFEGYDVGSPHADFDRIEVTDEFRWVVDQAALTPAERETIDGDRDDPSLRHRATVKIRRAAEQRQQHYYA